MFRDCTEATFHCVQISALQCAWEVARDQGWALRRVGQLLCPLLPSHWCGASTHTLSCCIASFQRTEYPRVNLRI